METFDDGSERNRLQLSMDGSAVFDFTMREIAPSIRSMHELIDIPMDNIYATPESDLALSHTSASGGGNIEDAIAGNIEVNMLQTLGEAWRDLKGFKLKCHIATVIWFAVYLVALLISVPVVFGLEAMGADESSAAMVAWLVQLIAIAVTMPMMVGITIMGIRHSQRKSVSPG